MVWITKKNWKDVKTYEKQVVHTRTRPEPSTLRTVPIFPAPPSWLPQTQSFPKDLHSITILSLIIFHRNYFPKIFEFGLWKRCNIWKIVISLASTKANEVNVLKNNKMVLPLVTRQPVAINSFPKMRGSLQSCMSYLLENFRVLPNL